jgi:peptidoglycan hydrolase-like protein with peptidoglycan-binding domain
LLRRAGYAITVDGDFGPSTKKAVSAFQKTSKITVDGVVGPKTYEALQRYKTDAAEPLGKQPLDELPEVKSGTVVAGGAALEQPSHSTS